MSSVAAPAAPGIDRYIANMLLATLPSERDAVNLEGVAYGGKNRAILNAVHATAGYVLNQWGTYRALKAAGLQVRKGEHGTRITYARTDDDGTIYRAYTVFNVAQCAPVAANDGGQV